MLEDLEKAAQTIARKAIDLAFDPDYLSPFSTAARRNGINIRGKIQLSFEQRLSLSLI